MDFTMINMDKKQITLLGLMFLIIASSVVIGIAAVFISQNNTPVETLINRIDEQQYHPAGYTANFMPYRLLTLLPKTQGPTVWWGGNAGQAAIGLSASDAEIARCLNITVTDLYCSNGTAKIFYGNDLDAPTIYECIAFKKDNDWCVAEQILKSQIPLWFVAIIGEHWTAWDL